MTLQATEITRWVMHPAEVSLPDGTFYQVVQAVVTDQALHVYRLDTPGTGSINEILSLPLSEGGQQLANAQPYHSWVTTSQGRVNINRGRGCNCGPLGAHRPYGPVIR